MPSTLPPAPATAVASSVLAAGLVLGQFGLCLPAAVAAVVVSVVPLVEGDGSRHPPGSFWFSGLKRQIFLLLLVSFLSGLVSI